MDTTQRRLKVSSDMLRGLASHPSPGPSPENQHKIIVATLRTAIIDGRLPPGYRITQQVIAEAFDVSRMPVREALRALEIQGYLVADRYTSHVVVSRDEAWEADNLSSFLKAIEHQHASLRCAEAQRDFRSRILYFMGSIAAGG